MVNQSDGSHVTSEQFTHSLVTYLLKQKLDNEISNVLHEQFSVIITVVNNITIHSKHRFRSFIAKLLQYRISQTALYGTNQQWPILVNYILLQQRIEQYYCDKTLIYITLWGVLLANSFGRYQ